MGRVELLGVGFDNVNMSEAVERGVEMLLSDGTHYVVTPNPEIVETCRENPAAKEAVNSADLVRAQVALLRCKLLDNKVQRVTIH